MLFLPRMPTYSPNIMPWPNPEGWTIYTAGLYPAHLAETRRKIPYDSLILNWENPAQQNSTRGIFESPSNGYGLSPGHLRHFRFLRAVATKASATVPIRDINRGWIQAAKVFCHFRSRNRVNVIVVYDFFCVSDACRESEQRYQRLMLIELVASTAEER